MKNLKPNNLSVETEKLIDFHPADVIHTYTCDKMWKEKVPMTKNIVENNNVVERPKRKYQLVWFNIIGFAILHLAALYGAYLCFYANFLTCLWAFFVAVLCDLGVTVGAHRLYTHRSYEATVPLRLFLLMCNTIAGQNCMWVWVRDHRQHHKYSDTDADPHNAKNGFFFSHIGWLMCRKHPDVIAKGKLIDMSDMDADPLVVFQAKYYKLLYTLFAIILPVFVPCYFWNESLLNSLFIAYNLRYMFVVNATWLVNSAAHLYGTRPYDKNLQPVEQPWVSFISGGEGWHNFHHAFPWDYRAAEFGTHFTGNATIIEVCQKLGLASNLRSVSKSVLMNKVIAKGDGTHPVWGDCKGTEWTDDGSYNLWGYGDKDMSEQTHGLITTVEDNQQRYSNIIYKSQPKKTAEVLNRNRKEMARHG